MTAELLTYRSAAGRWVLLATVLGSGVAMLDATVVNIALPAIGREFGGGLDGLQWTINGYTLTLAAFILLGGSLGDRYGRRRLFVVGVVWFAAASLLCGIAPNLTTLVVARALQGVGGALLTPGSLAIIQASFRPGDRARAIGAWSGLGGIAGAIGPFLGGWILEVSTWRLVFLINVPLAAAVVWVSLKHVPESMDARAPKHLDVPGAVLCAVGLAGLTYGLIAWPDRGFTDPVVLGTLAAGVVGLVAFVLVEKRSPMPMMPLEVFSSRQFSAANVVTFVVYGALGGLFFLLVVALQVVAGFSPLLAGTALLPVTVILLLLSARMGALAVRIGPKIPMTLGPIVSAAGLVLLTRIGVETSYWLDVLPGVVVFGLGLSLLVAPLTTTVLAAVEDRHAGMASGVNNAVARAAGLLAVAGLPLVVGITNEVYADRVAFGEAFDRAVWVCAVLLLVGAAVSWFGISSMRAEELKDTGPQQTNA